MSGLRRPDHNEPLHCIDCGSPDAFAVAPGNDETRAVGLLLARNIPTVAWCQSCWLRHWGER